MATKESKEKTEAVVEAVSKTDLFFKENKNLIIGVAVAAVLVAFGIFAFQKWYYQPKAREAQQQLYPAEMAFKAESWETALNGDGNNLGIAQVIEDYGKATPAAAWFEAGICELQLGNYESAIDYLKNYKGKDAILKARSISCMGDAYVGLEDYAKALDCFVKAAGVIDNIYAAAYLLKAGVTAEQLGKNEEALKYYKTIKEQYPQSMEGYDIDKYISRLAK
ncbi:MAG: tetratricopeptide repeat protein [Candidatus Cryptobacteroides sp.]|nr:tetratricopeptide repeat protein [Bacteroidales bacterium]MCI6439055.1 tetratricopeptide repeat protein [Alistipes sp.]MDY2707546.1 tetratricopeptide repeat protein [Candidatus Cryptobacteroides sp.]MCI6315142.1 tetratricopeptide repeat protein [Bacteroidales bacterium]MCI7748856.1 tetratricopeptide repeat protein [Bacteroidales bacterium]